MGSAFTINFPYQDRSYMAVISRVDESLNIYIPDETLHNLIPQGKITIDPQKIQLNAQPMDPLTDLIVTVLGVIEKKHKCSSENSIEK